MKKRIIDKLDEIAKRENVQILWACESGSRGWGFPSTDSDYDVRFIFLRNRADYSAVFSPDMDLRFPIDGDLDIVGWDLKKVLRLLLKSNVTPFEWIQSPIVYHHERDFKSHFIEHIPDFFCCRRHTNHYLGLVRSKMSDLANTKIRLKSLFYILRSLLAAEWSLVYGSYAPMVFEDLLVLMPAGIQEEVQALLAIKSREAESFESSLSLTMGAYIIASFQHLERAVKSHSPAQPDKDKLEHFFQFILDKR